MKRRICSYDLAAVPEDGYVVTDEGGEIYPCNGRCLCIWAISLATKPGLSEEFKARKLVLKMPAGEELVFETVGGLARWASSHALGAAEKVLVRQFFSQARFRRCLEWRASSLWNILGDQANWLGYLVAAGGWEEVCRASLLMAFPHYGTVVMSDGA